MLPFDDGVADFALSRGVVVSPYNLTVAHDEDAALVRFAGVHELVLGQSLAGKARGNTRRGVRRRQSKTAKSQPKSRNNESRSGHFQSPGFLFPAIPPLCIVRLCLLRYSRTCMAASIPECCNSAYWHRANRPRVAFSFGPCFGPYV